MASSVSYILRIIAAIIIGYAIVFLSIWLFSKSNKKKEQIKKAA